MSDRPARVDEHELHALADGALDDARRAEIEAAVAADGELQARVDAYRQQNALLRQAFAPVLAELVPARLLQVAARRAWWRRRWVPTAAAASLALLLGLGGGWWFGHGVLPQLRAGYQFATDGISAHRVYVSEVRHPVEVGASEEKHLVAWLSKRLAAPVKVPELGDLGYQLVGGRLLPAEEGQPAAQFMYETKAGERLTLYVRHNPSDQEAAFRFVQAEGYSAMYWLDTKMAYAIVAALPRDRLMRVSRAIYEQLDSK